MRNNRNKLFGSSAWNGEGGRGLFASQTKKLSHTNDEKSESADHTKARSVASEREIRSCGYVKQLFFKFLSQLLVGLQRTLSAKNRNISAWSVALQGEKNEKESALRRTSARSEIGAGGAGQRFETSKSNLRVILRIAVDV